MKMTKRTIGDSDDGDDDDEKEEVAVVEEVVETKKQKQKQVIKLEEKEGVMTMSSLNLRPKLLLMMTTNFGLLNHPCRHFQRHFYS